MNSSVAQILIPVDFSDQALIALDQSYNLAKFYKAELTLLYVIDEGSTVNRLFQKPIDEDAIKKQADAKLKKLGETVSKKHKIKVNTVIAKGHIYDKILEVADMVSAKMIIMGTNGTVGLKKRFIGSNALRVVKEAQCPVVTIKGKHPREGCKNIVLPIDLTKESREKVNGAIELGKLYGATIRVVCVLSTQDESAVTRLTRQIEQVKNFIKKTGVKCSAEMIKTRKGKGKEALADTIIEYANKVDADLIMIMTQQESNAIPLFIGSTAQGIINNSEIPVMSIGPVMKRDVDFSPY